MTDKANDILIRPATLDDLPRLAALVERSFRGLARDHYTPDQIQAALGPAIRVDRGLVADGTYFAAELGGEIVGCGGWSARIPTVNDAPLPSPHAEVRAMFVAPEHAGRGVGRALLRAAEGAIAGAGFAVSHLVATRSGVAFYRRAGYEAFAEHDVRLPGGQVLPCVCMRRRLAAEAPLHDPARIGDFRRA